MTQVWPLWWLKTSTATTTNTATKTEDESAAASTAAAAAVSTKSLAKSGSTCHCCCLVTKLMRKLKRRGRTLRPSSRQSSMQCRYDPLSYSLNFDSSGCGNLLNEDYYKFYAFSSRFAGNANSRTCSSSSSSSSSCPIVPVAATGSSH